MDNRTKLKLAIGKLLDEVNEAIDKKMAPDPATLGALKDLVQLTSLNHHID